MNIWRRIKALVTQSAIDVHRVATLADKITYTIIQNHINTELRENPRYQNPLRLNKYEHQVHSEHGEDGIIEEIFRRIGETDKYFVEFGVGDGLENNTTYLLIKGWTGCWLEADEGYTRSIEKKFGFLIERKALLLRRAFLTAENIETILEENNVPRHFDLLSIDVDMNTYWLWKAIRNYDPRVVVVEYNALFPPPVQWVVRYEPMSVWNGTCYAGGSLKSFEILGTLKGYRLVGCDVTGVNAFFVRQDLVKDKFLEPFTAENHYEPTKHLQTLIRAPRGFLEIPRDFGPFEKG